MADGYARYQAGGQYLYQPNHHQQSVPARSLHHRNGSPIANNRGLFPLTDTPSPNRSPGTHSPAGNPYSMYNNTSHRHNNALLNGAGHHNFQMQMNLQKHFQNQGGHAQQAHHLNQHHEDQGGHGGHGNFGSHQHNISASTLSNNTPQFTPAHLQNGTPNSVGALSKPANDHWQEQLEEQGHLRAAVRDGKPHYYARTTPGVSRIPGSSLISSTQRADGEEHGERRKAEDGEEDNVWQAIDFGGQGLKVMASPIFRYKFLRRIYFNNNKLSWLPTAIGEMRNLTVLDLSQNDLREIPPEIGMLTNLKRLLLYDNQLTDLPWEIGYLDKLQMLGLAGNEDLEPTLRMKIEEEGTQELVQYLREAGPGPVIGHRRETGPHANTIPGPQQPHDRDIISFDDVEAGQDTISVMSWNTLCDRAATHAQYGHAAHSVLDWENRKWMIVEEVRGRRADICCLQEVDVENYHNFFRPELAKDDYKGVFFPKNRARTMGEIEAKNVDGCATFYNNTKYILLDKKLIPFSVEAINRPDMKGSHDVYNRVMPKDHIAVVTFFENRMTGSRLIVVNTHLAWEVWLGDVKLIQVAILMEKLHELATEWTKWPAQTDKGVFRFAAEDDGDEGPNGGATPEPQPSIKYDDPMQIPLLICGDFNSLHDSGVYELMTQGSLSNSHADLGTQKYGDFTRNGIQHPFSLKSAYSQREIPFTNYTVDFQGTIDYIWFAQNALNVTALLGQVDPSYMRLVPGFPNHHFPSDHLALYAEFVVKQRKERKVVEADFGPSSNSGGGGGGRREGRQH